MKTIHHRIHGTSILTYIYHKHQPKCRKIYLPRPLDLFSGLHFLQPRLLFISFFFIVTGDQPSSRWPRSSNKEIMTPKNDPGNVLRIQGLTRTNPIVGMGLGPSILRIFGRDLANLQPLSETNGLIWSKIM